MAPIRPIAEENLGLGKGLYAIFDTTMGEMIVRLEEEKAPETVKNFVGLATGEKEYTHPGTNKKSNEPYYDGTIFHRIIEGFMIQGGDPLGQGYGGPGFNIKDEFHPTLRHDGPGILSMANVGRPHTGGSQFFITLAPTPHLDNRHAVFGSLVKGQDVLMKIGSVETGPRDRPLVDVKINSLRIVREK